VEQLAMSDEITFIGNRYGAIALLLIAVLPGALGTWSLLHDGFWAGTLFRFDTDGETSLIEIEYASSVDKPVVRRILDSSGASLSDILSELVDWRTRFGPPR
jgi:hypothetical protein